APGVRRRVGSANLGEMRARLLGRDRREARILGRYLEHANSRAVLRRRENDAVLGRLAARAVDPRRRLARVPDLVEQRAALAADSRDAGRGAVLEDDRASLGIVPGHDTAKGCFAHDSSPSGGPATKPPSVSANQSAM